MAIVATMNANLSSTGAIAGSETITIPTVTASTALDIRKTVNVPANTFQFLAAATTLSLLGGETCTGATGMWLIPGAGTTACAVNWGTTATSYQVGTFPTPVFISGGLTVANIGLSFSAATTFTLLIF